MVNRVQKLAAAGLAWRLAAASLAVLGIAVATWQLLQTETGIERRDTFVGGTPVTVHAPVGGPPGPAVVVAHGFSGSRPLMKPFATTLARNGYVAITYDALGHGRNPQPLGGDVTREDGATARLLAEMRDIIDFAVALPEADGRVGLLGHSMAADIVVRAAMEDPRVAATVAVSMFSPAPTDVSPPDLLIVVGAWEGALRQEALRVLHLAAGSDAQAGVTHADLGAAGTRRVAFAPRVEHIGVLYSPAAMAEAAAWFDRHFAHTGNGYVDARGPWVLVLILSVVALAWPLAALLPRLAAAPTGAGFRGWRLWVAAVVPAVLTPAILVPLDLRFLPMAVGDYLATHFALYGLLTAAVLRLLGGRAVWRGLRPPGLALTVTVAVALYGLLAIGGVVNWQVSAFWPTPQRAVLMLALLPGTLAFFAADEWLTRGATAPRGAYALTKLCFLGSLALAIALDLPRLFFLIIMAPALVLFFTVFGLVSGWTQGRTRHPAAGALANAAIFAMAIAVTFPMLAG